MKVSGGYLTIHQYEVGVLGVNLDLQNWKNSSVFLLHATNLSENSLKAQ